jgi:hypothetical protein
MWTVNGNSRLTAFAGPRSLLFKPRAVPLLTDPLLLGGAVALAIGLGAVVASFAPLPVDRGDAVWGGSRTIDVHGAPCPCSCLDVAVAPWELRHRAGGETAFADRLQRRTTGAWEPTGYPEIGSTLWDRVWTSSRQDRRAFLFGSSIQLHAPASAFPRPASESQSSRFASSHPHGVD